MDTLNKILPGLMLTDAERANVLALARSDHPDDLRRVVGACAARGAGVMELLDLEAAFGLSASI